ncbi:unnamed protein product [Fraxinus pennsylvanica]|uniref:Coatomer alpha subunit C-terminal domain-containing protein n=1 Tax=Fraxinus pennsylvanica TaxID=56036 RepID=A0AAD2DME4_9LAMI|nr:unnamed protein product [Fraxinus pennsylvanica]
MQLICSDIDGGSYEILENAGHLPLAYITASVHGLHDIANRKGIFEGGLDNTDRSAEEDYEEAADADWSEALDIGEVENMQNGDISMVLGEEDVHMEIKRKELTDNPIRQQELAAYFTHCKLQLPHRRLPLVRNWPA